MFQVLEAEHHVSIRSSDATSSICDDLVRDAVHAATIHVSSNLSLDCNGLLIQMLEMASHASCLLNSALLQKILKLYAHMWV